MSNVKDISDEPMAKQVELIASGQAFELAVEKGWGLVLTTSAERQLKGCPCGRLHVQVIQWPVGRDDIKKLADMLNALADKLVPRDEEGNTQQ